MSSDGPADRETKRPPAETRTRRAEAVTRVSAAGVAGKSGPAADTPPSTDAAPAEGSPTTTAPTDSPRATVRQMTSDTGIGPSPQRGQGSLFEASLAMHPPATPNAPDATDATLGRHRTPRRRDAEPSATKDHRHGHRNRLRDRLAQGGSDALPDYELLEMLLFRVFPRGDTKALAKRLIATFGSFAEVVYAPASRLKDVDGIGDRAVAELLLIRTAAVRLAKGRVMERLVLSSWADLMDYLRSAQAFADREQFRVLFLDKKNNLIADEVQGEGTVDHTPVYVREVVKRALELSATAIILVHNHPSGDPTPSRADIDMTRLIMDAARPLGVTVHDHVIVGRNGYASFKQLRLI